MAAQHKDCAAAESATVTATQAEVQEEKAQQQNNVVITEITVTEVELAAEESKTAFRPSSAPPFGSRRLPH